jgi:hypothetical protein
MDTLSPGCCRDDDCCAMPAEFVRVRYFYGQRLGVMELADEAAYHAGKQAFHNARLHGAGVLCGLAVARFVYPQQAQSSSGGSTQQTTLVRVTRGAALDPCGREIIVCTDQCIDVAAWYAKNKSKLNGASDLYLAIRYRECPSDPSPAPRDPCGCDNGGCEFGRTREGFELGLLIDPRTIFQIDPGRALIDAIQGLSSQASGSDLAAAINDLTAKECPSHGNTPWLLLAHLNLSADNSGALIDVTILPSQSRGPSRLSILPTSALQALALSLVGTARGTAALSRGPVAGAVSFDTTGAPARFTIPIILAEFGTGILPVGIVPETFTASMVSLEQLNNPQNGWNDISQTATIYRSATDLTQAAFIISCTQALSAGIYRLAISSPPNKPIADGLGRPLLPWPYARTLKLVADASGVLQLDPNF